MKSISELSEGYRSRINQFLSDRNRLEIQSNRIGAGRLVLFILTALLGYLSLKLKSPLYLAGMLAPLSGFLWLLKKSVQVRRDISYKKILIRINEEELKALQGDFSSFESGSQFIDYQHEYSFDLDIFGEHSLYRLVNRATTPQGKERMATRLLHPGTDPAVIRFRQESVRELVPKLQWRHDFLAVARESDWENLHNQNVRSWLEAPDQFSNKPFYRTAILVNTLVTCCLTLLFLFPWFFPAILPFAVPPVAFVYFLVPIGLIISRTRLINREQQKLERLLDMFRKYSGLLNLIETENFQSPYLQDLKKSLEHDGILSSRIMKKLTEILWGLEVRGNLIVSFLLNSFFLWDILLIIRLERWRSQYREDFGQWVSTIAEFETLNSLANLSFNRPDLSWPEIRDGEFSMDIVEGGHVLIQPERRVDNSLNFHDQGSIYLITGANMAGKSTLLRMVGVNMILAMAGGPVCARHFSLVPVSVHTSVRTNDSLGDDESYFYAELKKLSRIISRMEKGERLFVILDEMLKGTNSHDKHTGSAALIHRLAALGASGLVATHDIELGALEKDYPGKLVNHCFEVITDGDHLKFDYRLYPGISKNLNATFLMRKMGIIKD
jgi:DNA mismatch repair ATPase MutS